MQCQKLGMTKSTFEKVSYIFVGALKWQTTQSDNSIGVADVLTTGAIFLYHELHL